MTAKTLEEEAREAAVEHCWRTLHYPKYKKEDFIAGYTEAATARDKEIEELRRELESHRGCVRDLKAEEVRNIKEIEELRTKVALLEVERNAMLVVLTDYKRADREASAEIATLQARVAGLEGMVPRWVEDQGKDYWCCVHLDGWFCAASKNGIALMVPPIPLPEGED